MIPGRLPAVTKYFVSSVTFCVLCVCSFGDVTLHVSPGGDDANPGTRAKPLASLDGARKKIRSLKPKQKVIVSFAPGRYAVGETVVFTPEDSGTADAPIIYRGAGIGKTEISGGIEITGWKKGPGNLWQAAVPQVKAGKVYFHTMFILPDPGQAEPFAAGYRRCTRARTPNEWWLRTNGPEKPLRNRQKARRDVSTKKGFRFRGTDLKKWDNLDDVNLVVFHSWTASTHFIADLDCEKRTVTFTNPCAWPIGWWEKFQRYRVENCFAALDAPGEWYLDRAKGVVYYRPRKDEDLSRARVVAPVVSRVIRFTGDLKKDTPVAHVHFENMSILHADWQWARQSLPNYQAHKGIDLAVIHGVGYRNGTLRDLEVAHGGAHGIFLDQGSQDCLVQRCHVHDMGGGGVYVGPSAQRYPDLPPDPVKVSRITVDNCFIHDITHLFHGAHGIWVGRAGDITATHNDICDCDYTPIALGWAWNYRKTYQENYIVEYNHLHHADKYRMSDYGGIYTLGVSPGSRLRYNLIHDMRNYPHINYAKGIYPDQGSQHFLIEGNITYNIAAAGFGKHWGQENTVRNNIFACADKAGFLRGNPGRARTDKPMTFERNIVYQDHPLIADGCFSKKNLVSDNNLFWCTTKKPLRFNTLTKKDLTLEQWRAMGFDNNSIIADPLFVDPEKRDFRLKKNSPAYTLGFVDIPVEKIGLCGDPAWVALPKKKVHEKLAPPPGPPAEVTDHDFETDTPGELPAISGTIGFRGEAKLAVTAEQAASGRQSLKFIDGKGANSWEPSWHIDSKKKAGTVHFSCDLMNDKTHPNTISIEFRDWSRKKTGRYLTAATIRLSPAGVVTAGGKQIAKFPNGTWIHLAVEFSFAEGKQGGTYLVRVGETGKDLKESANLPIMAKDFELLTWTGISALARDTAIFYVDNLKLAVR